MSDGYNAADLKAIRRAQRAAKQAEAERASVILNFMSNPAGRNWMYDRLLRCHVFSTSFSLQALAMAYAEGERNIGLQDLNDIMRHAPDQYIAMMREANDREQANGRDTDSGHRGRGPDDGGSDSRRPDDAIGSGRVDHDYEPGDEAGLDPPNGGG